MSGNDYSAIQSAETFTSGAARNNSICVDITVIDDSALEGDQTFSLMLNTLDPDVLILINTSIIKIIDNDGQY